MSTYQYVYFAAVDRQLDDKQLEYMQRQSTRAEITRWQFENEYHYGDFHGNALEMMRRGYDVHVHYANFGIRKLMFRLPLGLPVDVKSFKAYQLEDCVEWQKDPRGRGGVLSIQPESDGGDYTEGYYEFGRLTETLPKIRERLLYGDSRALYLGWLACIWDEDSIEPPVPAGLKTLPVELEELADFYAIDPDLLTAVAESSPVPPKQGDRQLDLTGWLENQSPGRLRELMLRVLKDDAAAVRLESLADIRQSSDTPQWPTEKGTRTVAELRELATSRAAAREQRERATEKRQRERRLGKIRVNPQATLDEAEKLIQSGSTSKYPVAAKMLAELRDAFPGDQGARLADQAAKKLAKKHPTLNHLKRALKAQGLNYK